MKTAKLTLLVGVLWIAGCNSATKISPAQNSVRSYNGTAAVGDFLTISLDPNAFTIAYQNYTNGESGTVPYSVNSDGSYTITDPDGNLLAAYEVPGSVMVIEAANAGPNKDTVALITAIESVPVTIQNFEGKAFNYTQFRTRDGGVEIGTGVMDSNGNTTGSSYDPGAIMWTPPNSFGHNSTSGATATEDPSGNFFTITDQTKGESMTVFGTQNGMFAMDGTGGAVIGLPQASSKDFDPTVAGTYSAIYYQKVDAQMQNNVEVGTPSEGKATVVVDSSGGVTIIDNQSNTTLANGTLVAIADDTDLYDGSTSKLSSPCNGLFTFVATGTTHQETFVTFVSNAVIFSGFETAWPAVNNGTYTYFYGVGLK